jgi:hypothetical protein
VPAPVGVSPRDGKGEETAGALRGLIGPSTRPAGCDETVNALTALSLFEALRVVRAHQILMQEIHLCAPLSVVLSGCAVGMC